MKNLRRVTRKSYAMKRMGNAIERAIHATTSAEKERSARWAAAWGLLCGIHTSSARLRNSDVQPIPQLNNRRSADKEQLQLQTQTATQSQAQVPTQTQAETSAQIPAQIPGQIPAQTPAVAQALPELPGPILVPALEILPDQIVINCAVSAADPQPVPDDVSHASMTMPVVTPTQG
jgi:hypothetical protein